MAFLSCMYVCMYVHMYVCMSYMGCMDMYVPCYTHVFMLTQWFTFPLRFEIKMGTSGQNRYHTTLSAHLVHMVCAYMFALNHMQL